MRPRLADLAAAAILIAGTSAVHADIFCAVELGYLKDVLRARRGPACPFGERLLDPAAIGQQRLPEPQDAPTEGADRSRASSEIAGPQLASPLLRRPMSPRGPGRSAYGRAGTRGIIICEAMRALVGSL
jgi:hypothetical protein